MAERLRVGIVGMGWFGRSHAEVCADLAETELVAACSRRDASLAPMREQYGIRTTTDLDEFVHLPDLDAVIVCTPTAAHRAPAVAAASAGKHVFVEKPMAAAVADCDAIIAAAEANDVRLMVGHIVRFDPRYWQLREMIARGEVGPLIHMFARRNNPREAARRAFGRTSPTFWLGSHDIDMFLWCADSPVRQVYAQARYELLGRDEGPDAVLALITFESGAIAALETCWVLPEGAPSSLEAEFEAVCAHGCLRIDASTDGLTLYTEQSLRRPRSMYAAQVAGTPRGILSEEVRHFARCVLRGEEFVIEPRQAREVVRVACAIDQSARSGKPVSL